MTDNLAGMTFRADLPDGAVQSCVLKGADKKYSLMTQNGEKLCSITEKRPLFMPAYMPRFKIALEGGGSVEIKRDLQNYSVVYEIRGEGVSIADGLFGSVYGIDQNGVRIADVTAHKDEPVYTLAVKNAADLKLAAAVAGGVAIVRSIERCQAE